MLWDVVGNDNAKDKVFHGAISQEDMLAISRQARLKESRRRHSQSDSQQHGQKGTLTKTVAKKCNQHDSQKRLKTQMSDAQSGIFDPEVLTTPDATKLASGRGHSRNRPKEPQRTKQGEERGHQQRAAANPNRSKQKA